MGCESAKEKIETQMMTLKLERADIMAEREDKLKELEKITGETVIRSEVPDYIAKLIVDKIRKKRIMRVN